MDKAVVRHHIVGINAVAVSVLNEYAHIVVVCEKVKVVRGKFILTPACEDIACGFKNILCFRALVGGFKRYPEAEPEQRNYAYDKNSEIYPYRVAYGLEILFHIISFPFMKACSRP